MSDPLTLEQCLQRIAARGHAGGTFRVVLDRGGLIFLDLITFQSVQMRWEIDGNLVRPVLGLPYDAIGSAE